MFYPHEIADVDHLSDFDTIIDVRSPGEYAEDHIPGAINCPVLDDEERVRIGTLYTQTSPFAARRQGAVLIAANIAHHLQSQFLERPPSWKPLIYCWRGGQRSAAMTTIFRQIGWAARQLRGGYRAWRRHVVARLSALPAAFEFRIICGSTGVGKSRILHAIERCGEQVLDLEALADHKGSVFGLAPNQCMQPSQKRFESLLYDRLNSFDPARPVYAEAESRKIGNRVLPDSLYQRMHAGKCIEITAPLDARVDFLISDYDYFQSNSTLLRKCLHALVHRQGHRRIAEWERYIADAQWQSLVRELLLHHYDPLYHRSQEAHYRNAERCSHHLDMLDETGFTRIATIIAEQ